MPSTFAIPRRRLLRCGWLLLAGHVGLAARAAPASPAARPWPSKAVRLVVASLPGGAADTLARSMSEVLQREFSQPFVVDNRPGAGGNIGTDQAARAPSDGYTLLVGIDTVFTVNPFIYKNLPFKSSDLRPILVMASQGMMVVVNPQIGVRTLDEFIARGRQQGLTLASAGYGTPGHLASAILAHETGAKVSHVPYKGNVPASMAVLSGEVDGGILGFSAILGQAAAGKVTPLAVTTRQRNPVVPEVATVAERGHKYLEQEVLLAVWVPSSVPEPVVASIQAALEKALQDGLLRERMRANDLFFEGLTGQAAAARIQALADRYRAVIQSSGMKME